MRALVLHPGDSPFDPRWSGATWNAVLDLGTAGPDAYAEWSLRFRCPVSAITALRHPQDPARLRELLNFAQGRVVDDRGLDWWELNSVFFYQQLDQAMLLVRLAEQWRHAREIIVSRPCLAASILQFFFGERVHVVGDGRWLRAGLRLQHYSHVLSKFSMAQLGEILGDKYDPEYRWRRHFKRRAGIAGDPVVLMPSAYSNASKILAAYARLLPEQQFLLVATRRSATAFEPPPNMKVVSLAAYAHPQSSPAEFANLLEKWNAALACMQRVPELNLLISAGVLKQFPRLLVTSLAIRDGWLNVFEHHQVAAVFSGDEGNPYVCIPLKLGAQRRVPSFSVHHGALDGRFLLKDPAAEVCLGKSKMELDYLVRAAGLPAHRVVLGAPGPGAVPTARRGRDVVFFSEPYEILSGRTREIYRELLPPLCRIAATAGSNVLLKLHPFESVRERHQLLRDILPSAHIRLVEVLTGPLLPSLFDEAWFGVTVQSTVAMECALAGLPCFLCGWLADPLFGYARQFARFGAGYLLKSPEEITNIPWILADHHLSTAAAENLWSPLRPSVLRELLAGMHAPAEAAVAG